MCVTVHTQKHLNGHKGEEWGDEDGNKLEVVEARGRTGSKGNDDGPSNTREEVASVNEQR